MISIAKQEKKYDLATLGQKCSGAVFICSTIPKAKKFPIIWELEKSADLLFHCFCAMITTANSRACLLIRR